MSRLSALGTSMPGQALHLRDREGDDFRRDGRHSRRLRASVGVPPQNSSTSLRGKFQPRHHEFRIDAALEAVARIGDDAERAAGAGDVQRLPQRRFDQHIGGVLVAAGMFAAHDAGDRIRRRCLIGDDAHLRGQRVFAAVERQHLLAIPGAAHGKIALRPCRRRTHAAAGRGRR